ncbi:MAG TPA: branched-chain amino acid aminotransferase [Xanthobacteraceae bacterium]|nr:branched-chain amino acid aminotransferase [Xanthobacteraceae bacterium]
MFALQGRTPRASAGVSATWTFFDDDWHAGDLRVAGPRTHAFWLGSMVFDGARAFEGVTPDLDLHCARVNDSAATFMLEPLVPAERWVALAREGLKRFPPNAELYIRPMYWAERGPAGGIRHDPESTRWCLCVYEAPLPKPRGASITLSPFRRPTQDCAPVEAKAGCLYPNNARAVIEAQARGFDNCLLRDALGNIAELATANVFMAKDGAVFTPAPNGTFLNGITRQRVIKLLRGAGVVVVEKTLRYEDFATADEIFSSGNFSKLAPITRIDARSIEPGPFYRQARQLYWDFAHDSE